MVELTQERDGGKTKSYEKNVRFPHRLPSGVEADESWICTPMRGRQGRSLRAPVYRRPGGLGEDAPSSPSAFRGLWWRRGMEDARIVRLPDGDSASTRVWM